MYHMDEMQRFMDHTVDDRRKGLKALQELKQYTICKRKRRIKLKRLK